MVFSTDGPTELPVESTMIKLHTLHVIVGRPVRILRASRGLFIYSVMQREGEEKAWESNLFKESG